MWSYKLLSKWSSLFSKPEFVTWDVKAFGVGQKHQAVLGIPAEP